MQGLADGYFVIPYTLGNYFVTEKPNENKITTEHPEFEKALIDAKGRFTKLLNIGGKRSVDSFHKQLGHIMWEHVGMSRTDAGLKTAIKEIQALRKEFWKDVKVTGSEVGINVELEKANRVADFIELGELMARDALTRNESCGGHFRDEMQTPDGEALRDDENFCHVAAWEWTGENTEPIRNIEELSFENVHLATRSYK